MLAFRAATLVIASISRRALINERFNFATPHPVFVYNLLVMVAAVLSTSMLFYFTYGGPREVETKLTTGGSDEDHHRKKK